MAEEIKKGETWYAQSPEKYYQRVVAIQKEKIERQGEMLSRLQRVYDRHITQVSVREAVKFLVEVIINKIKKIYGRISNK